MIFKKNEIVLGIIGLGYVGLPLALRFASKFKTLGYDINKKRVNELNRSIDKTNEVDSKELKKTKNINFSNRYQDLANCNVIIITVPTPINSVNKPELGPLKKATLTVCKILKKNDIIIYESTVYPGLTENFCGKIIEQKTGKKLNKDFFLGYSPERINPGDKKHRIHNIKKIVSGSNKYSAEFIKKLYGSIITAGVYLTSSIAVAESAKVIENTQRDVNIALINELAIIFNKLELDTEEILNAAGTKWNFLPFKPGLVGGHCIGVDPYYLTYRAKQLGYNPMVILSGRKVNNNMGFHISKKLLEKMSERKIKIKKSKILIMGYTFKENCPDFRNTKVTDIIKNLERSGTEINIYDPWVDINLLNKNLRNKFVTKPKNNFYDGIVLAVKHNFFKTIGIKNIKSFSKKTSVIYDVKYLFKKNLTDLRL